MIQTIEADWTKKPVRFAIALKCLAVVISTWIISPPAHAVAPSVVISGGEVTDGAGDQVVQLAVDVVSDFPSIDCQPNDPNCNDRTVPVCVDFNTVEETATEPEDFQDASGQLNRSIVFHGGGPEFEPLGTIEVVVKGDTEVEGMETFKVMLKDPSPTSGCINQANIGVREARITIVDGVNQNPDLAVTSIRLNRACQIAVRLTNQGSGPIPDAAYDRTQGAAIQMQRNGEPWGGTRLVVVDPLKKLQTPGASITHIWLPNTENLRLGSGVHMLKVIADQNNAVVESNENNNTRTQKLFCALQ